MIALLLTIFLALTFTGLQVFEYIEATFKISDGIYGSTFFMATGFHGYNIVAPTKLICASFSFFSPFAAIGSSAVPGTLCALPSCF